MTFIKRKFDKSFQNQETFKIQGFYNAFPKYIILYTYYNNAKINLKHLFV